MANVQCSELANVMSELYFVWLKHLDLMDGLNQAPFRIQQRRTGFTPAMRRRRFYGNRTFLMLSLIAATLTQMIRQEAIDREQPIPPGLQDTLVAVGECGLRLRQDPVAGCELVVTLTSSFTDTFRKAIRCACQHRFGYAA